ncbi:MAG: hypothetical protein MPJ24_09975 [Pirellulaceae bacterium]|nr:hypothetical protein [Pirellulaceae bacterium]
MEFCSWMRIALLSLAFSLVGCASPSLPNLIEIDEVIYQTEVRGNRSIIMKQYRLTNSFDINDLVNSLKEDVKEKAKFDINSSAVGYLMFYRKGEGAVTLTILGDPNFFSYKGNLYRSLETRKAIDRLMKNGKFEIIKSEKSASSSEIVNGIGSS